MFAVRSSFQAAMKRAKREQKKLAKEEAKKAAKKETKKKPKVKKMKIHSALGTLWEDVSKQLKHLDRSVEDQCLDMRRLSLHIENLNKSIDCHTKHQLVTKLVWKIGGFKRLLRDQATVGGLIYSPKFMSHAGGYSLMCSICCVELDNKDYLSLMVCMVRGPYDAHQLWPFGIPIRFSILAQNAQDTDTRNPDMDIVRDLDSAKVNEHTEAFERPTEAFGRSVGFRHFAEKEKVLSDPYLQNDVLFVSISMDQEVVEEHRLLGASLRRTEEGTIVDLGEIRDLTPVAYSSDKVTYWPRKDELGRVPPENLDLAAESDEDSVDPCRLEPIDEDGSEDIPLETFKMDGKRSVRSLHSTFT